MRVELSDTPEELVPGEPVELVVNVTNSLSVIDGVRVVLADAHGLEWSAEPALLPLFPDGTGTVAVSLTAPAALTAGSYTVPLQVRSSADPEETAVRELQLTVRPAPSLALVVEVSDRSARHRTTYEVTAKNTGNVPLDTDLGALAPARTLRLALNPAHVTLEPGAEASTVLKATCRRHMLGTDMIHRAQVVATSGETTATAAVTFRQRPVIPRGVRTALLLGIIVAVWAAVIVIALNHALNSNPPEKVVPASFYASSASTGAQGSTGGATGGATGAGGGGTSGSTLSAGAPPAGALPAGAVPKSGLSVAAGGGLRGVVDAASTKSGVGRITVQAYALEANGRATLETSTATKTGGSWALVGLLPGPYRVELSAQGFHTLWYPKATTETGAKTVFVHALGVPKMLHAVVTGLPGSITGSVVTGESPPPTVKVSVTAAQGSALKVIATVSTNRSGSYTVTNVPTPNTYDLTFTAKGYQPASDTEVLTGGQRDIASAVTLTAQPGAISGTVAGGEGPVGGVTVTAVANGAIYKTLTPTSGAVGFFTLGELPSPSTYLLTFSAPGYGARTIAEHLGPGEDLAHLAVHLSGGAGDISGTVRAAGGGALGGVSVTVSGTAAPMATETLTAGNVGSYLLTGLPTPGHYTLTFSYPGYESVTVPVDLRSGAPASGVNAVLPPATGTIDGTVDAAGSGLAAATVTVTNGGPPVTTTSATSPPGSFTLTGLPAGTYSITASISGYAPDTVQVQVIAGGVARPTLDLVSEG